MLMVFRQLNEQKVSMHLSKFYPRAITKIMESEVDPGFKTTI